MLRKLGIAAVIIFSILGGGYAAYAAVAGSDVGTNVSCATATATTPDHTVGVDGSDVDTISGTQTTASHCETQTYTIPTNTVTATVTQTVTGTPTQTTSSTPTTTSSTTNSQTTTTSTTSSAPSPFTVDCPLTFAAGNGPTSCWATHTGVQGATGATEAQIKAGAAGFTKHNGELDITQPNTVIDHEWINGCISIADGANNTVIKDSLVTSGGGCSGDDAGGSAINTGQGPKIAKNTLIEDTTVDGGTPAFGSHDAGITVDGGEVLRVNLFGFAQGFISDSNTAAAPALFQDDYAHDFYGCSHDDGTWVDSSSWVTFEHIWVETNDSTQQGSAGCSTAAFAGGSDFGPQNHITYDSGFADGVTGENIHTGCGSTQMTITNNAVDTGAAKDASDGGYGSLAGNTWSGNYSVDHATGAKGAGWGPFGNGC